MEIIEVIIFLPLIMVYIGIFGSIFIATIIYNLNYYMETRNENLRLKIELRKIKNEKKN